MKKENIYILVAIVFVTCAIVSPFIFLYLSENSIETETIEKITKLGPVGDYIGGTTIALFNIASFSMLVAALVMQKEELKLQREEITKTREEYELTNKTMKKQQFESTFFNMITLHQSISKNIGSKSKIYNDFISELKKNYDKSLKEYLNVYFKNELNSTYKDKQSLENIIETIYLGLEIKKEINDANEKYYFLCEEDFCKHIESWLEKHEEEIRREFNRDYPEHNSKVDLIDTFDYVKLLGTQKFVENPMVTQLTQLRDELKENPKHEIKMKAYDVTYLKFEDIIGHYFRNLYRIEKLLSEQGFSFEDRNSYRGIWRAQLSSSELMMLFYNVNFSEKGYKFKTLLLNTGFFDDHIKNGNLIWDNDHELLPDFRKEGLQ